MKISALTPKTTLSLERPAIMDGIARKSIFRMLEHLQGGSLTIVENDVEHKFGDRYGSIHARVFVSNSAFYRMMMSRGTIGAGEAFMLNFWNSPELTDVVRLMSRNMGQIEKMDGGLRVAGLVLQKFKHWLSSNTLSGSRKNIHAHYDLSNDLFEYFLDSKMMYSSAIFEHESDNLEQAAEFKLKTIGDKLELLPEDHVLEIGTGWGGLAIYLAQNYGCRVTTTTISHEQHEYARKRIEKLGLCDQITLLEKDYRLLDGAFDKLVSVEMIEAVGQKYLPTYFEKCSGLLKAGGKMLIQAITIPEQRYQYARRNVDFIQRYIFPGGSLPSVEVMLNAAGTHTSLQIEHLQDIGLDYAQTLNRWHQRFNRDLAFVREMGFDETFIRLWQFYLSYCEGGFRERAISTAQIVFRKV